MRTLFRMMLSIVALLAVGNATAQKITARWAMDNLAYDGTCMVSGNAMQYVTKTDYKVGANLSAVSMLTQSSADNGLSPVTYPNPMMAFQPSAKVSGPTAGHNITFSLTIAAGHTFKPTAFKFNAAKIGTDGGGLTIRQKIGSGAETDLCEVAPRRNKITAAEKIAYTDGSQPINDVIFEGGQTYSIIVYITGSLATNKQLALGNVAIEGAIDEDVKDLSEYISAFSCKADGADVNL